MAEIDECRLAVLSAYIWISRMKSTDPAMNAKIGHLRIDMEKVRDQFDELFP